MEAQITDEAKATSQPPAPRKIPWKTIGVIVAAICTVVVAFLQSGDQQTNSQVAGDGSNGVNQVQIDVDGGSVTVNQGNTSIRADKNDPDGVREELEKLPGAKYPPRESPAPFLVSGTGGLGLFVRDGYTENDSRIRVDSQPVSLADGSAVYVDCKVTNKWAPFEGSTTWYKIRWPEVSMVGNFWSNEAWLLPAGHNGDVPDCDQ